MVNTSRLVRNSAMEILKQKELAQGISYSDSTKEKN